MRYFEVPYNFDKNLITELCANDTTYIHSIFFPPYYKDYFSAKTYITKRVEEREDYADHIQNLQHKLGYKGMLLIQNKSILDTNLLINFYISRLKITKFCVGCLEQAKIIKSINPDFEVVSSVCMKLEESELCNEEYSKYFDYFILWFPFYRNLKRVSLLPKYNKYIVLANCVCSIYCNGTHHWFTTNEDDIKCPMLTEDYSLKTSVKILPEHLPIWDKYVSVYKIQGRELSTQGILNELNTYLNISAYKLNEEDYKLYQLI